MYVSHSSTETRKWKFSCVTIYFIFTMWCRIYSQPGPWSCAVKLCWWHEQQSHCRWLENKAGITASLVDRFPVEATGNCFSNIWACQREVHVWLQSYLTSKRICANMTNCWGICRDNLKNILQSVYANKESVDDELVEVLEWSSWFCAFISYHLLEVLVSCSTTDN